MSHHLEWFPPKVPERVAAVVIPLDGSEFSERALPVGARLADRLGADIALLSAVPTVEEAAAREAELGSIADGLPRFKVHCLVVVDRDAAGAIHEAVQRPAPAFACMASHGRGARPR